MKFALCLRPATKLCPTEAHKKFQTHKSAHTHTGSDAQGDSASCSSAGSSATKKEPSKGSALASESASGSDSSGKVLATQLAAAAAGAPLSSLGLGSLISDAPGLGLTPTAADGITFPQLGLGLSPEHSPYGTGMSMAQLQRQMLESKDSK